MFFGLRPIQLFFLTLTVVLNFACSKPGAWAVEETTIPVVSPVSNLRVGWQQNGVFQTLKGWSLTDLEHLKKVSSREKNPGDGKMAQWKGPSLGALIEDVLKEVPPEKNAQIDLIVLRSKDGQTAQIPRFF